MSAFIKIERRDDLALYSPINAPYYFIILLDGYFSFSLDFNSYKCDGKTILFLSPYQLLKWDSDACNEAYVLQFHGDFYCIEYHKEEVACNGILFNNVYESPFISVSEDFFNEVIQLFLKMNRLPSAMNYDVSIIRSYLQLILALCSKEKQIANKQYQIIPVKKTTILHFKALLDEHFIEMKSVAFYAEKLNLSVNDFSKKVKKQYGKTPSKLIRERLTLEAKRLLHLTYKSIKEIAHELGFNDEFYFSRYFKKEVGVSPKVFREKVGISIAAK